MRHLLTKISPLFSSMVLPALLLAPMVLAPTTADAGKKKKKGKSAAVVEPGWHTEEGWMGSCYNPPDFSKMGEGTRRIERSTTMDAMLEQWGGQKNDGISFDSVAVTNFETAMLAKLERVETVSKENYAHCVSAMQGKGTDAWQSWFMAQPAKLTEGECPYAPLDYTMYNYLSINDKWQVTAKVCQGDHVRIHGTTNDWYRIEKDGPFINALGDSNQPATGNLPCTEQGCLKGMLLAKFTADAGWERIMPVGDAIEFKVPEHGRLEVMINDDDLADNFYKIDSGLEHKMGIEYKPVKDAKK